MGTKVAPSLANVFMSDFEEKYIYTYGKQPIFYKRFLDDLVMIWTHGQEELEKFLDHLNKCHETIKFTMESSLEKINFLDTTLHKSEDGTLWTDLYSKPTDSHNYLHYESAHPSHCKKSLPYSQMLRIKQICTKHEDYLYHVLVLCCHFLNRGYPLNTLIEAIIKASKVNSLELLEKECNCGPQDHINEIFKEKQLFLITTFEPEFPGLKKIIQDNWDLLNHSSLTKLLAETRVTFGYRRPQNLRDLLVRARIPQKQITGENRPHCKYANRCNNKKCQFCLRLDKTGRITSTYTGREYQCKKDVTCKSNNLIYCITCTRCGKQYVGQTGDIHHKHFGAHATTSIYQNIRAYRT